MKDVWLLRTLFQAFERLSLLVSHSLIIASWHVCSSQGMVSVAVTTTVEEIKLQEAGADAVFKIISDISFTDLSKAFNVRSC